jgi:hypothetical protein
MVSVASTDDYHVGLEGAAKQQAFVEKLTRLFERHGLRESGVAATDRKWLEEPGPLFSFFGAQPDSWIGKLWPRGRAWENGLSTASLADNFCNRWSGGLGFLEHRFEGSEVSIEVTPSEGVDLVGTVDAVYREELGGHRLVDWKTGELGDPEDQLLFYALVWALDRGELPAYVEAVSVRTGERYRAVPSSGDVGRVAAELGDLVSAVRSAWASGGDLLRSAGPWCRYCPLLEDCAEGKAAGVLLD